MNVARFYCETCEGIAIEGDHECPLECDVCGDMVARDEVAVTANGTLCILCLEKQVEKATEKHP